MELTTKRLLLKTLDLELLAAAEARDVKAIEALGYQTNGEWPGGDFYEAIPYFRERLLANNGTKGFDSWLLVERQTNEIVGGTGFVGDPDQDGMVEIGFATNESHRGRGYCLEAGRALLAWAYKQEGVNGIKACCEPANYASQKVLERLGFVIDRRDEELIYWKHRSAAADLFTVNHALCLNCGVCAAVCPNGLVEMNATGPQLLTSAGCMACGHCVAVCPQAALDWRRNPLADQTPLDRTQIINSGAAKQFLRARRSIRNYQKSSVPRAIIMELLDIARYAPTGGNSQGLSYLVIDDTAVLQRITAVVIDWAAEQIKNGVAWAQGYARNVARYRQSGSDVVLRGAPCLIVALASRDFARGRDNSRYCLEYVELYATALGLGTCWAGFVERAAADHYQPLLEVLQLPENQVVAGTMMVGYPQYGYQRLVARDAVQVRWR